MKKGKTLANPLYERFYKTYDWYEEIYKRQFNSEATFETFIKDIEELESQTRLLWDEMQVLSGILQGYKLAHQAN